MKKLFALFLALTMVFSLAACGNSSGPSATTPDPTPSVDVDISGMEMLSGTIHFNDTYASTELYYSADKWVAKCVNKPASIDETVVGTINYEVLKLDLGAGDLAKAMLDELQALYDEKFGVTTLVDTIDFGVSAPEVTLRYSDRFWHAYFHVSDPAAGVNIEADLAGSIADGILELEQENTDGMAKALFLPPIQAYYTSVIGTTYQQASNAFANDLLDLFQALYEKALAADNNMKTVTGEVDFGGVATCPVVLHYNDGQFVLTYYFEVADKNVFITGTITDGNLAIVSDSTGTTANDLLPAFQTLYDQTT